MIRQADPIEDFPSVFNGAGEFVRFVNRPDILPAPGSDALAGVIRKLFSNPGFNVLLDEQDGLMTGGIGYWVGEFLMNVEKREFQEIFWWAEVSAPPFTAWRLARAAKQKGVEAGASIFTWHRLTISPEGVDAVYRRLGAEPLQVTYVGVA